MDNFNFKVEYVTSIASVGKSIGAGLATVGLAGAGVGVGIVFGSLVFALR
jgi:F-type H+-transporting ATPase subunit c